MTESVHWSEVAQITLRVLERVVAPLTPSVPFMVEFQLARREPETSRLYHGFIFQIPIYEPLSNKRVLVIPVPLAMNLVR